MYRVVVFGGGGSPNHGAHGASPMGRSGPMLCSANAVGLQFYVDDQFSTWRGIRRAALLNQVTLLARRMELGPRFSWK